MGPSDGRPLKTGDILFAASERTFHDTFVRTGIRCEFGCMPYTAGRFFQIVKR